MTPERRSHQRPPTPAASESPDPQPIMWVSRPAYAASIHGRFEHFPLRGRIAMETIQNLERELPTLVVGLLKGAAARLHMPVHRAPHAVRGPEDAVSDLDHDLHALEERTRMTFPPATSPSESSRTTAVASSSDTRSSTSCAITNPRSWRPTTSCCQSLRKSGAHRDKPRSSTALRCRPDRHGAAGRSRSVRSGLARRRASRRKRGAQGGRRNRPIEYVEPV